MTFETNLLERSPPLSTDHNGCIKPQKIEPCDSCQGRGYYSSYDVDGNAMKYKCGACHGLLYQEKTS